MTDSPARLAAEIRKLERKHEEDPEGRFFVPLADAYRQLGELEHAELLLRDGLRRHPEYLGAHIVLGRCLLDRGEGEAAAQEFRQVVARDPQNLVALRALGELATASGHREEAERWYRELLAVDPLNEEARCALEELHAADETEQGEVEPPAPGGEEERAEEGWEEGEVVTETIAELYARQGVYDRAAEVYRELLRRQGERPELSQRLREIERLAAAERTGAAEVPALQAAAPEAVAPDAAGAAAPAPTIAAYLQELLAWTPAARPDGESPTNGTGARLVGAVNRADDFSDPPVRSGADAPRARAVWQRAGPELRAEGRPAEAADLESFQQWLRSLHG